MASTLGSNYQFSAEPRPVHVSTQNRRPKYREPVQNEEKEAINTTQKANLMFDKRVVRGNTYSAQITSPLTLSQTLQQNTRKFKPTRSYQNGPNNQNQYKNTLLDNSIAVQTEDYLEELTDQIFEQESSTQTEFYEENPVVRPLFIKKQLGIDAETQIKPGDLFDFDSGCEPLLEVLLGKTLDQSLTEVLEEQELFLLKETRERFIQERNIILAETQRLEATALRKQQEKEKRMEQEKQRVLAEKLVANKLSAAVAAKLFLQNLQSNVMDKLQQQGHFYDPIQAQVTSIFIPQLLTSTLNQLNSVHQAQNTVNSLLLQAIESLHTQKLQKLQQIKEAKEKEEARILAEENERKRLAEEKKKQEEEEKIRLETERLKQEEEERLRKERENEEDEDNDEDDENENDDEDEDN